MGKVDITKKEIATAFKNLMEKKSFDSITVSEIMSVCGLNRLTFYYHFQDKYDLLDWLYQNEIVNVMKTDLSFETWPDNLFNVLTLVRENKRYYRNALIGGKGEFADYVVDTFRQILSGAIEKIAEEAGISNEEKRIMLDFFSYGVTGLTLDWVKGGMAESPHEIIVYIKDLVENGQALAASRYQAGMRGAGRKPEKIQQLLRSEERRVGKECRSRWSPYH